jgi:hypothetical protein
MDDEERENFAEQKDQLGATLDELIQALTQQRDELAKARVWHELESIEERFLAALVYHAKEHDTAEALRDVAIEMVDGVLQARSIFDLEMGNRLEAMRKAGQPFPSDDQLDQLIRKVSGDVIISDVRPKPLV